MKYTLLIDHTNSGLVPLHNACSYGHREVTEALLGYGANVNALDLWQFTPLHEAASKARLDLHLHTSPIIAALTASNACV